MHAPMISYYCYRRHYFIVRELWVIIFIVSFIQFIIVKNGEVRAVVIFK